MSNSCYRQAEAKGPPHPPMMQNYSFLGRAAAFLHQRSTSPPCKPCSYLPALLFFSSRNGQGHSALCGL
uniref:Uncharacterized protein n=1 Tax=Arundo donax TaxID=35708 RepID=A0A0A9B2I1_ARUDO